MTLEYVNYILQSSKTKQKYSYTMHTFMLTLESLVDFILLAIFIGIVVHPSNAHRKYYSSRIYSQNFINSKLPSRTPNIIQNIRIVHIGISCY